MVPSGAAMAGVHALAEDLIGNRLSRSVADINPYPAPAVPRRHMTELIAVIVIVRIIIVAVRSAEADKPPEVMTMIEEMAMVEERTMVQTGDMHSSWPKGTDSRWARGTESRWTRNTDSRWRRSAEMRAAHGGTTALKTTAAKATAAVKAATAEATAAVATAEATAAVATAEATTAVATATTAAATASPCNIGRGEGDANCRHSGKKKSDSAHGTSPRIGIAPCRFNTTHAKLFRSRNVASGLFFFRRSHDRYDLLRQFSRRQASMLAIPV